MAVSVFDPGNVFVTLSTVPFERTDPLARALRSTLVEPAGFSILNQIEDLTLTGFTSDVPGIQARPIELALENILLLASLATDLENRLVETRKNFLQLEETLNSAIRNEDRNIINNAETTLQNSLLAQIFSAAQDLGLLDNSGSEPVAVPKFKDFTFRPTETNVFGTTVASATREGALNSHFLKGVSLSASDEIFLSDLLLGTQSASATHYIVSLQNEIGGEAAGSILDGGGSEVANGTVITAAELSTFRLQASTGGLGSLDFLSIVELRDPEGDAIFEGRGAYRTIAVHSGAAVEDRSEGSNGEERIKDFTFFTESGTAFTQIRLQVTGVNSLGFTDALSAIEGGALRVKVGENLIDGSTNIGQVDRSQSSGDTLVIVFPFQAAEDGLAQNGLDVELRALNSAFDLSTVEARAEFP